VKRERNGWESSGKSRNGWESSGKRKERLGKQWEEKGTAGKAVERERNGWESSGKRKERLGKQWEEKGTTGKAVGRVGTAGKAVGRERNGWERHMGRGMPIGLDAEFERPCKANFETCKRAWNIITISFTYIIYIKTPSQITSFVKSLFHSQPKSNYSPNWGPRAVRN